MQIHAVMPAYNHGEFIAQAVESAVDQVGHLVVVNDGSTDNTREILDAMDHPNLTVVHHEKNLFAAEAINTGVKILRGYHDPEWLTWISADNYCHDIWAGKLLSQAQPGVGAVYSGFRCIEVPQRRRKPWRSFMQHDPLWFFTSPNCYYGASFIIREDVWQEHRGRNAHDLDNWMRVEEACWDRELEIVGIDEDLVTYRDHAGRTGRRRNGQEFNDIRHWHGVGLVRRRVGNMRPPA